jgi:cell division septum initiation protein DivIVA
MRFLIRLAVLALAAVGAKTLYEQFAPRASQMRGPASDVLSSASDAARNVTQHAKAAASDVAGSAKDAAAEVADDAKRRADEVRAQATAATQQAADDAPTIATSN